MAQRRSRRDIDESIAIDDYDDRGEAHGSVQHPTFVIAALVLSPYVGFCWRLMLVSFLSAYHYARFVARSCRPPRDCRPLSPRMVGYALNTALKLIGLVGICAWSFSLTPVHVLLPTATDFWTPYSIHEPLRRTQIVYDPGEEATVDIFAIHGLGSRPDSAWTYNSNATQVRWLSDLLPGSAGLETARVIMVNHQTRWDSNSANMDLADHASDLLGHIESHHKAYPARPVIFISHSFGGLLLKKALLLAKSRSKEIAAMTRGIIFLGVPHRGTNAAYAASCLSCMAFFRGSSSHLLQFMAVDSPGLLDLESEFYDAYVLPDHPRQLQPYICDVLETRPERMGKLALGSIVRPKHGLLRHGRIFTLDTDHRGLNKFSSEDDPNFQVFSRILSQAVTYALDTGGPTDTYGPPHPDRPPPPPPPPEAPPADETQLGAPKGRDDIFEHTLREMRWTTTDIPSAAILGALHEVAASYLASDRDRWGNYLNARAYKMGMYACLIELPVFQTLSGVLFKVSEDWTSVDYRLLQLSISRLAIVPMQAAAYLVALAIISGARTSRQVRGVVRAGFGPLVTKSWLASAACIVFLRRILAPGVWPWLSTSSLLLVQTRANVHAKKKRQEAVRMRHTLELEVEDDLKRLREARAQEDVDDEAKG